jgi:hypothetical protein
LLQVQIPVLHECFGRARALQRVPNISLDLELAVPVQVVEVTHHTAEAVPTLIEHLDHHFGCPSNRARDEGNLPRRKPVPSAGAASGVAGDIE